MINGMLWIARTGAPWRDLPQRYGSFGTVASRFYRWRREGLWQRILEALQAQADRLGRIDWGLHFIDSTVVRAHQHAVGARKASGEKGGSTTRRLGGPGAASRPKSTSAPRVWASR